MQMFFLFSHYASNIDFSDEKILEARKALGKFDVLFYRASGLLKDKNIEPVQAGFISKYKHEFIQAMDDDFVGTWLDGYIVDFAYDCRSRRAERDWSGGKISNKNLRAMDVFKRHCGVVRMGW